MTKGKGAAAKTAKKSSVKAGGKKSQSKARAAFLKEVSMLIEGIDESKLPDLLKNFGTAVKNQRVLDSFKNNREIREEHNKRIDEKYAAGTVFEITEGPDNLYFVMKINGKVKSFTLEEMRKLVKIAHNAPDETQCARMFYNWFSNFRKDFLSDLEISGAGSRILADFRTFLKSRYAVKS